MENNFKNRENRELVYGQQKKKAESKIMKKRYKKQKLSY